MITLSNLNTIDKQGLYKVYDTWPKIAKESYESSFNIVDFRNIDHVVFSGMGGSGAVGDILAAILSKTDMHVDVVKGYHLPKTVGSTTLIVPTSVSGNTVETLTVLNAANKAGSKIICFSSGGRMESYCKKNEILHRKISFYQSSRASFPAYVYSILRNLEQIIPIKKHDIEESINELERTSQAVASSNLTQKNPSLKLAQWIDGIPVIYHPWGLHAAAIRFKSSLQENAKNHAFIEDVIEASHNGIVGWERKSQVKPILVEGSDDHVKTKERWDILKEYFQIHNIDYYEVKSVKGSIISKLINLIYQLDYASIYLAILFNVDPSPVKSIDFIKERL